VSKSRIVHPSARVRAGRHCIVLAQHAGRATNHFEPTPRKMIGC
jgi:hypothetical protein